MPRPRTSHLRHDEDAALTLCGEMRDAASWRAPLEIVDVLLDADKPCKTCTRLDAVREPPFVSGPAVRAVFGQRAISASGEVALEYVKRTHVEGGATWSSAEAAARSCIRERRERELFGIAMRSTASPSDRVQHARDPSLGGREH